METGNEMEANFPFAPYKIQLEYSRSLYELLDRGQVGIFESPTGTVLAA
jgi:chromosome transmission fidelity protein 1